MSPPIPSAGLAHVLSAWSGQGQLLQALAAVPGDDPFERVWTARDVRRRANRVLFAVMLPDVARLPTSVQRWHTALPAESAVIRSLAPTPHGGFEVVRTRLRGWPPDAFVVRRRERIAEEMLARTTAWALDRLLEVSVDAASVEPHVADKVVGQLAAAKAALDTSALAGAATEAPDRTTLSAVRRAGPPWSTVAAIARHLRASDRDLETFSRRLIEPDDRLRWRLFHLGVLGEALLALVEAGFEVISLSPLSASAAGANYRAIHSQLGAIDIWFEAAGVWRAFKVRSPYVTATASLRESGSRPLGPDLLLVAGRRALVIECKYSAHGTYIAGGYEQVVAYAAELLGTIADSVTSAVVGPEGPVKGAASSSTGVGQVHVLAPDGLRGLIDSWVR